jgi:hypothetical protein
MRPLAALLLLAACASPSPQFFDARRSDVVVEGRSYAVFRDGNRAQVIRLGYASPAERRAIPDQMLRAVALATGCSAVASSFTGDSGERRGRLTC